MIETETTQAPPVLWEHLQSRFNGRIRIDRRATRDWRNSRQLARGEERAEFVVIQPLDLEEVYQEARQFLIGQGLQLRRVSPRLGYAGWFLRGEQGFTFLLMAMGRTVEVWVEKL